MSTKWYQFDKYCIANADRDLVTDLKAYHLDVLGYTVEDTDDECPISLSTSDDVIITDEPLEKKPKIEAAASSIEGLFVAVAQSQKGVEIIKKIPKGEIGSVRKAGIPITKAPPAVINNISQVKSYTISHLKNEAKVITLDTYLKQRINLPKKAYDRPKINLRSVGVNTDVVCKSDAQTQDEECDDFDEIWQSMQMDTFPDLKLDMQTKQMEHFKLQLFEDLKICRRFNMSGNLPLHEAVFANDVKRVIRQGIAMQLHKMDIDTVNSKGMTALQLAVISKANIQIIQALINNYEANVKVQDVQGNSLIHLAVLHAEPEILEVLIQTVGKSNCDTTNYDGITPLILSITEDCESKTESLLRLGIDANSRDQKSGRTALFHAVESDNLPLVQLLLKYNAQTRIKNFVGTSPHEAIFELEGLNPTIKHLILTNASSKIRRAKRSYKRKVQSDPVYEVSIKKKANKL